MNRIPHSGAALGALLLALLVHAAPAGAHGQKPGAGEGRVEPALDPLPEELAGLTVQIHESLAPQIVLENRGEEPVVVLDERGAPFLRIGPGGVEANLASPSFYLTASPSDAVPIPEEVAAAGAAGKTLPPRWKRIARERSWGWFDRRIEVDELDAPHAVVEADRTAEIGRWEIPLAVADERRALRGSFLYRPGARGHLRARIHGERELAPGVRVSMLAGRAGSLFLRSDSAETVTVLGRAGEPFLRFSREGVAGNRRSPTFYEVARLRGAGPHWEPLEAEGGEPEWEPLSPAPRYGWVDPRTLVEVGEAVRAEGERKQVAAWSVPVRIGAGEQARVVEIEGGTWWEPRERNRGKETTR